MCFPSQPRSRLLRLLLPVAAALFVSLPTAASEADSESASESAEAQPAAEKAPEVWLEDVAPTAGLDFVQWSGAAGRLDFLEMMGGSCAFFDADGDGDLDVYLGQGALIRPGDAGKTLLPPPTKTPGETPTDRLYRNDSSDGTLRFVDTTAASGLVATGYGQGVVTGDADGDGHLDLFIANYGPDQLWRSRGDGTFENVTKAAGVGRRR